MLKNVVSPLQTTWRGAPYQIVFKTPIKSGLNHTAHIKALPPHVSHCSGALHHSKSLLPRVMLTGTETLQGQPCRSCFCLKHDSEESRRPCSVMAGTKNLTESKNSLKQHYQGAVSMAHPWPTGCMQPEIQMSLSQHKIIHPLKA